MQMEVVVEVHLGAAVVQLPPIKVAEVVDWDIKIIYQWHRAIVIQWLSELEVRPDSPAAVLAAGAQPVQVRQVQFVLFGQAIQDNSQVPALAHHK